MNYPPLNSKEKLAKFSDHWSPKVVADMNDYQFKLVKIQGDFVWHEHTYTDEVFVPLDGRPTIQLRDGTVVLSAREMLVVPEGIVPNACAEQERHMLLVESRGVRNTSDAGGEKIADNYAWG